MGFIRYANSRAPLDAAVDQVWSGTELKPNLLECKKELWSRGFFCPDRCTQIPAYHDHPFSMFPFSPPSSNSSLTTIRWRNFMLL